jgi:hypothetical protein
MMAAGEWASGKLQLIKENIKAMYLFAGGIICTSHIIVLTLFWNVLQLLSLNCSLDWQWHDTRQLNGDVRPKLWGELFNCSWNWLQQEEMVKAEESITQMANVSGIIIRCFISLLLFICCVIVLIPLHSLYHRWSLAAALSLLNKTSFWRTRGSCYWNDAHSSWCVVESAPKPKM